MSQILLFHHCQGLTEGLRFLARRLEATGHTVTTPDAFAGRTFSGVDEALAFAGEVGHEKIEEIARQALHSHPHADTVIGFSLGAFPAQLLAQESRRIKNCVLVGAALAPQELHGEWRHDVRLAVHIADPDEWVNLHSLDELLGKASHADVHRYRGVSHMFVDPSTADYDADAADRFEENLVDWLSRSP